MKKNEQKLSDLNLTKSDFQKIECGKRLKKAIEKRFKTHELFRAACQKESGIESGYEFISKHFLSQIINGKAQLPRDKAVVFSNVLGVSSGYLLGLEDYPSKDDEKIAMLKKMYSEEQSKIKNTNSKIEFALRMLCENGYGIRFEILIDTEEDSQKAFILCDNNTFTLYESSGTCIIPYSVFSEVFDYGSFTIRREGYEGYRYGQSPEKVYMKDDDLEAEDYDRELSFDDMGRLTDYITIYKSEDAMIKLDKTNFMKMMFDIYASVQSSLNARFNYWMEYSDFKADSFDDGYDLTAF